MQTSTKEAFLLLEDWRLNKKLLHVVSVPKEGRGIGARFDGHLAEVNKNSESVKVRRGLPGFEEDVEIGLAGALFEYFEPRRGNVVVGGDWLCLLKVSLFSGGMVLIGVPG